MKKNKWLFVPIALTLLITTLISPLSSSPVQAATQSHTLKILDSVAGKTPQHIGENITNANGFNWTASNKEWIKNSGINAVRVWFNIWNYEPQNDNGPYGNNVTSLSSFNAAKNAVLANPESNSYINWDAFNARFANSSLDSNLDFLSAEGITPIIVLRGDAQNTWFPDDLNDWDDYWEWWEFSFALVYHAYKNYGFVNFEIGNEPNINGITAQNYVKIAQYASDAIRSAVHKVNASETVHILTPALSSVPEHTNPTDDQYLADTLNLQGTGIDTQKGDYNSDTISFHAYRSPAVADTQNPSLSYQQANVGRIQDVIRNNNPDGQIEDLYVTETNAGLSGHNPDDPHVNAQLAQLYLQLIHQAKTYDSSHSWLRGILKFKFDDTNNSVNPGSPEYTGVHQYYFTYNLIAKAASKIKDILNVDTTLPGDQLLVSRDPSYYYVLLSNLSSADTQKIDLDTTAIGISNAPAYFTTSNANQAGTRWDKTITNGALTFYIAPDTVTLIKIPRGYTARTISSIDISPSSTVSVGLYGAKEFTATAHYTDGTSQDISDRINWASSNNTNVQMLATGLAFGKVSGTTAAITGSYQGVTSNSVTFQVN